MYAAPKRSATHPRSLLPSSSSSRSEGGLVRGGHERVDTFRARMEAEDGEHKLRGRNYVLSGCRVVTGSLSYR